MTETISPQVLSILFTVFFYLLSRSRRANKAAKEFILILFSLSFVEELIPRENAAILAKVVLNIFWITMVCITAILFLPQ